MQCRVNIVEEEHKSFRIRRQYPTISILGCICEFGARLKNVRICFFFIVSPERVFKLLSNITGDMDELVVVAHHRPAAFLFASLRPTFYSLEAHTGIQSK